MMVGRAAPVAFVGAGRPRPLARVLRRRAPPRRRMDRAGGSRIGWFRDPDGNTLSLQEVAGDSAPAI